MRSEPVQTTPELPPGTRIQPAECETHGAYEQRVFSVLNRELRSNCPECTRIAREKSEAAEQANKAMELRMSLARKLGDALIPKRFTTRTLGNYQAENEGQRKALRFCQHYVQIFDEILKTGRCMVLIGKPGTGKTHLGAGMANELLHNTSRTAVYRTVGAILQGWSRRRRMLTASLRCSLPTKPGAWQSRSGRSARTFRRWGSNRGPWSLQVSAQCSAWGRATARTR